MKDIQKEPIQAQAPAPKQDNTALKVVIIVLIVVFGFPLILIAIAFIFISSNWDRIEDWLDKHIDEWGYSEVSSADITNSARKIHAAIEGKEVSIYRNDCYNVKSALGGSNDSSNRLMRNVCDSEEMKVAIKDDGDTSSLFFAEGSACLEMVFSDDFERYRHYNYNNWSENCGMEMQTIKLEDFEEDINEDEDKLRERGAEQINV